MVMLIKKKTESGREALFQTAWSGKTFYETSPGSRRWDRDEDPGETKTAEGKGN